MVDFVERIPSKIKGKGEGEEITYIITKDILGKGGFARVYGGFEEKHPDKKYAIKRISKSYIQSYKDNAEKSYLHERVRAEVMNMRDTNSENVLTITDALETTNAYYLILPLCDINLKEYLNRINMLRNHVGLSAEEVYEIAQQLLNGLFALHQMNIIHRDLKLTNIFIQLLPNGKIKIKIGDLGISKMVMKETNTLIGSWESLVPQADIEESKYYSHKVDIWGFGVILFELMFNILPCTKDLDHPKLAFKCLQEIKHINIPVTDNFVSQEFVQLLDGCLKIEEKGRFDIEEVKALNYFKVPLVEQKPNTIPKIYI